MTVSRSKPSRIEKIFVRLGLLATAISVLTITGWSLYPHAVWFYEKVPIVRFKPACKVAPTEGEYRDAIDDLYFLEGQPTEEFWLELYKDTNNKYLRHTVHFIDGIGYVAMKYNTPPQHPKYGDENEENAHYRTRRVAWRVVKRREQEGFFENIDMSEYFVTRSSSGKVERRRPDECGFVEEFIMKGGRFAKEGITEQ